MPTNLELYQTALEIFAKGVEYKEARGILNTIIKDDPTFTPAYLMRAITNAKLGNDVEVLSDARFIIKAKIGAHPEFLALDMCTDGRRGGTNKGKISEFHELAIKAIETSDALKSESGEKALTQCLAATFYMLTTNNIKFRESLEVAAQLLPNDPIVKDLLEILAAEKLEQDFVNLRRESVAANRREDEGPIERVMHQSDLAQEEIERLNREIVRLNQELHKKDALLNVKGQIIEDLTNKFANATVENERVSISNSTATLFPKMATPVKITPVTPEKIARITYRSGAESSLSK